MTTSASKPDNGLLYLPGAKSPPITAPKSSAITGANFAFSSSSRPALTNHAKSYSGTNGALAAASAAGKENKSFSTQSKAGAVHRSVSRDFSGYAGADEGFHIRSLRVVSNSLPTSQASVSREPSPSHVAALLAVSKSSIAKEAMRQPPSSAPSRRPHMIRSRSDVTGSHTSDIGTVSDVPTKKLVAIFESMGATEPNDTSLAKKHTAGEKPRIVSPTPVRPAQVRTSFLNTQAVQPSHSRPAISPKSTSAKQMTGTGPPIVKVRKPTVLGPTLHKRASVSPVASTLPEEAWTATSVSSEISTPANVPLDSFTVIPQRSTLGTFRPIPSLSQPSPSSLPSENSPLASSHRPYRRTSSSIYGRGPTAHTPEPTLSLKSLTPQLTADSLANAMVASSLASSRAASPSRSLLSVPPALPASRKPRPTAPLFHRARSSETVPTMRVNSLGGAKVGLSKQTFRTLPLSDEDSSGKRYENGKDHHRPWKKKHPNKHHEGDRKRWKDEITERERKRYEGLWAANKGMLFSFPQQIHGNEQGKEMGLVHPLIVKDIWRRSKLPHHVLEEIWDLVTITANSVGINIGGNNETPPPRLGLDREAFVVGIWLIDQKLKGRKLPNKVGESVWGSVRGLTGVRVRITKR